MKKWLLVALAVMLILSVVVGCDAKQNVTPPDESLKETTESHDTKPSGDDEEALVFGYSPCSMSHSYYVWMEKVIRDYVEERGDTLITVDCAWDSAKQIDLCEDLLMQDIDVLLISPLDSLSIKTALLSAQEKKVPVVIVDSLIFDFDLVVTDVHSDSYNAGYVCGLDMLDRLPAGGEVAIIGSPTAENPVYRANGFRDAIEGVLTVVDEQDGAGDLGKSLPIAEDMLIGHPNLKGFFCINDQSALACVQAVKAAGRNGEVLIYGVDGSPDGKAAIEAGEMTGTAAQSPTNIARISIESAYAKLRGEDVENDILVETFLITAENLDEYGVDTWQ